MTIYTIAINGREQKQHESFSTLENAKQYASTLLNDGTFKHEVLAKTYNSSYQVEKVEVV
jgi:hypothetical protein